MQTDDELLGRLLELERRLVDAGEALAANLCFSAYQRLSSLLATVERVELERAGQGSLPLAGTVAAPSGAREAAAAARALVHSQSQ